MQHFVTTAEVVARLSLSSPQVNNLQKCGLLGQPIALDPDGKRLATPRDRLEELENFSWIDLAQAEPAVVVKTGAAIRVNEQDRQWAGWDATMPDDVAELATARWWPVPRDVKGYLLVVVVSTFAVRVRRIVEVQPVQGGRSALITEPTSDPDAAKFLGKRVKTRRGPLVDILGRD